jgi:hypothetical protein
MDVEEVQERIPPGMVSRGGRMREEAEQAEALPPDPAHQPVQSIHWSIAVRAMERCRSVRGWGGQERRGDEQAARFVRIMRRMGPEHLSRLARDSRRDHRPMLAGDVGRGPRFGLLQTWALYQHVEHELHASRLRFLCDPRGQGLDGAELQVSPGEPCTGPASTGMTNYEKVSCQQTWVTQLLPI